MNPLEKEYDLPLRQDLFIYKGDTYAIGMRLKDEATDTYFDLTGVTVLSQARETVFSESILFTFTTTVANQADLVDGRGLVYIQIPDAVASVLPSYDEPTLLGVYDIQITYPSGKRVTYIFGDLYIMGDASR